MKLKKILTTYHLPPTTDHLLKQVRSFSAILVKPHESLYTPIPLLYWEPHCTVYYTVYCTLYFVIHCKHKFYWLGLFSTGPPHTTHHTYHCSLHCSEQYTVHCTLPPLKFTAFYTVHSKINLHSVLNTILYSVR